MENSGGKSSKKKTAKEHVSQLQRLQEKDPEFYEFLKEHDKQLLEFNDEGFDEDEDEIEEEEDEIEMDGGDLEDVDGKEEAEEDEGLDGADFEDFDGSDEDKPSSEAITSEMVDSWCKSIRQSTSLGAVRSLLRAYRAACHYGDDASNDPADKLSAMSSSVFNKIMQLVLREIDGVLRGLFKLPPSGGNKDSVINLKNTRQWKRYNHLVKSYLGNSLHVLNQMTDTKMISYTLRRLGHSSIFLAAFPALLRKYVKVILHFWGTGGGALPIVSFLFMRDLCLNLGSECMDDCFKGMYKGYITNCKYVNAPKLQHIQFLGNCIVELARADLAAAYQHAFIFIRQLAMILREALSGNEKESLRKKLLRKVYGWQFMNCLELWTGVVCAYSSEADLKALAYPLTQIITGAARLVPTAQYFPLRLRCIRMLNRIARSTGTFIPVSFPLLDMLEMKELNRPPTGGVGNAVDFRIVLKVKKKELKTRTFQEACVFSVIEELTEHLVQWSYSVAFFELSFLPAVRLRNFCKSTKVERFRREMRNLIRQIEANCDFTNKKRASIPFRPNDLEAASFLEEEKKSGSSPLSQYVATLRRRALQRNNTMLKSSVVVGEHASVFGSKLDNDDDTRNVDDVEVFSSSWLPAGDVRPPPVKEKKKKRSEEKTALEDDIVEDLVLSSDEEDSMSENEDADPVESKPKPAARKQFGKKRKPAEQNPTEPKQHSKKRKQTGSKPSAQKWHGKKGKPAAKLHGQADKKHDDSISGKSNKRKRRN